MLCVPLQANYNDLSPAEQPTPTTQRLNCMDRAVGEPTSIHRPVEVTSPRWFPLPAVGCPLIAWWVLLWTWAAATSSPAEVPTWSMEEIWREAVTIYHTHHVPPQPWWATPFSVLVVLFSRRAIERTSVNERFTPQQRSNNFLDVPKELFGLFLSAMWPQSSFSSLSSFYDQH